MDKYEDTVVNPNISLKNFEVRVRDDVKNEVEPSRPMQLKKKDKNYQKSILLLVILAAILVYQVSITI